MVEHFLGKEEVPGSSPGVSSRNQAVTEQGSRFFHAHRAKRPDSGRFFARILTDRDARRKQRKSRSIRIYVAPRHLMSVMLEIGAEQSIAKAAESHPISPGYCFSGSGSALSSANEHCNIVLPNLPNETDGY